MLYLKKQIKLLKKKNEKIMSKNNIKNKSKQIIFIRSLIGKYFFEVYCLLK